ncbi:MULTISPECIES: CHAD domain-containing protein [Sphingobium]|uniref:CHAD domain-containing protein n=1 Tax=Sphingobium TaxID=165695 RepID=UPI0015EB3014|nr:MULTISPECIES: CHAD domain-containing protein [Sphingobium]MCW2363320.1 CHAD domain-containing protein [Sphingobium sp. B10D3B]MCW2403281.1 CHAD domain-containing protein [Sphingobium sp. B10D7B]MCW2406978.1 CHAD domain-containing protein [Sphingobium xanthum]
MPFRFRSSGTSVEEGFRRIACERLDEALALIRGVEEPPARIVHQLRRTCKAMRGLLRLVRPAFPAYQTENAAFRDIAAMLSGARDSEVLIETLDSLIDADEARQDWAMLRSHWAAPGHGAAGAMAEQIESCRAPLLAARVRAPTWALTARGEDAILPGLRKTYRQARQAMRALEAVSGTPAAAQASHAWRKHVKYHGQHIRLLSRLNPDLAKRRLARTDRLGDLLGDRHDLDMLIARLRQDDGLLSDPAAAAQLAALAHQRAEALARKAARLGEALLAEKPSDFAANWATPPRRR